MHGFQEHRDDAIRLFQECIDLLDKYNIDYFLISGTLLGCVRHNDFIPWDDDIDLIVSDRFSVLLPTIKEDLEKTSLKIYEWEPPHMYKLCFKDKHMNHGSYNWPFIDLFQYTIVSFFLHFFHRSWAMNIFFPVHKTFFHGRMVSIPKRPHRILSILYGKDYMEMKKYNYSHRYERDLQDM